MAVAEKAVIKNEKPRSKRGPMAGIVALCVKVGPKLISLLLKVLKSTKVVKVGMAGATVTSYSVLFSWKFALMIMALLFIHENGHIWAMKRYGMKVKGIYFIPFAGAAAVTEESFPSRKSEVVIALAGPVWGMIPAFIALGIYSVNHSVLFAAAAAWMALVNLFNLMPINPLDGGRVMKSIMFSISSRAGLVFMFVGLMAAGYLAIKLQIMLFLLLLIIGAMEAGLEYVTYRRMIEGANLTRELLRMRDTLDEALKTNDAKEMLEAIKNLALSRGDFDVLKHLVPLQLLAEKGGPEVTDKLKAMDQVLSRESLERDLARRVPKPIMTRKEIFGSVAAYLIVAGGILWMMISVSHIAAAGHALSILK